MLVSKLTLFTAFRHADFYLGNPMVKFSGVVDTGSNIVHVPCKSCASYCGLPKVRQVGWVLAEGAEVKMG